MGVISVKEGTKSIEFDKYEIGTILNALKFYKELKMHVKIRDTLKLFCKLHLLKY